MERNKFKKVWCFALSALLVFVTYSFPTSAEVNPTAVGTLSGEAQFGLVEELTDGDTVILYNPKAGLALSSQQNADNYLEGVPLTPVQGSIITSDSTIVWTVRVSDSGVCTFVQGEDTVLSCSQDGKNNTISTDADKETGWQAEKGDPKTLSFRFWNTGLESSKEEGHVYLEWYNSFTVYDYVNPGANKAFLFQVYKQGAEPAQPEIPYGDKGRYCIL